MAHTRHCSRWLGLWLSLGVALLPTGCSSTTQRSNAPTAVQNQQAESAPSAAPAPQPTPLAVPSDLLRAIDYARSIGSLLYRHERAADRANALLRARKITLPSDMRGWVTEQIDGQGAVQVTFVTGPEHEPARWRAWNRVLVRAAAPAAEAMLAAAKAQASEGVTEEGATDDANTPLASTDQLLPQTSPTLSTFERNKLSARTTALATQIPDCGNNIRVVVIAWRRAGQDIFLAYRLSDGHDAQQLLLGGQHEFVLDAQGRRLLQQNSSEAGCSTIARGNDATAIIRSRTTEPTPTLFDIYMSLREARPMQLTTAINNLHWQIDGDAVRLLGRGRTQRNAQTQRTAETEPGTTP